MLRLVLAATVLLAILPSGRWQEVEVSADRFARWRAPSGANGNFLVPQYLTPFPPEYPRATPSFVRREIR